MLHWVEEHILVPTVHAMKRSRRPFRGVLYAGVMITNQGPKVLEYNVRFGDPEAQPLLMRLKTDLVDVAGCRGQRPAGADRSPGVGSAAGGVRGDGREGYPGDYRKGLPDSRSGRGGGGARREGLPRRHEAGKPAAVTNGGRVLGVTALGDSIAKAKLQAYTAVRRDPLGRGLVPEGHFRQGISIGGISIGGISIGGISIGGISIGGISIGGISIGGISIGSLVLPRSAEGSEAAPCDDVGASPSERAASGKETSWTRHAFSEAHSGILGGLCRTAAAEAGGVSDRGSRGPGRGRRS